MDDDRTRERLLDTAEELFYGRGIQAVPMDELRTASGVPLKTLYRLYPGKGDLVEAFLLRFDQKVRQGVGERVARETSPRERILAVFAWIEDWSRSPDFRGCAFINAYGEMGATSPSVAGAARTHKVAFRAYLALLVDEAGGSDELAEQLTILANGTMATAAITPSAGVTAAALAAARVLLDHAGIR